MVTFGAREIRSLINTPQQPAWVTVDDKGCIVIDKIMLLKMVRTALRAYNNALPGNSCWNWKYLHCSVFTEMPLKLHDLDELLKNPDNSPSHAHVLIFYDGSNGRGIRSSWCWEKHLREKNLPGKVTTCFNSQSKQPMVDCRKTLERYLTDPTKGFVDLNY